MFIHLAAIALSAQGDATAEPVPRILHVPVNRIERQLCGLRCPIGNDIDAFMTTKEKGMGIGLAVSRSTVEVHGGRLWADNNKTGGAIFNVALPLSHASPTTAQIQEYA